MTLQVFYSPRQTAPQNVSRSPSAQKPALVVRAWEATGIPLKIVAPRPATFTDLGRAHDSGYVRAVLAGQIPNGFGNTDPAVNATLLWTSGSLISAAEWAVAQGEPALSPTSGFHHADGRAFADALKQASGANYGHAGPEFVAGILSDERDLPTLLAEYVDSPAFTGGDGLEMRAAGVFALCGFAGELATEYGLTGWPEGAAIQAAADMFRAWREFRGGGETENRQIIEGVRNFILMHGDSRFSPLAYGETSDGVRDRAGYYRDEEGGRVHLFNSAALKEAASGYDLRRILDALDAAGWIVDQDADKRSKRVKVGGNPLRLYAIRPAEEDGDGGP